MISPKAIELIKMYADENIRIAQDGIIHDPILSVKSRGKFAGEEALRVSEDCQIQSTIHSSKYHAAKDILELLGVSVDDF